MDDKKLVVLYLGRIKNSEKIFEENKKEIIRYYNIRTSNGVAVGSNRYVLFILLRLGEYLNKSFKDATADDLMDFFCNLKPVSDNGKSADKYADRTMWTYKASV